MQLKRWINAPLFALLATLVSGETALAVGPAGGVQNEYTVPHVAAQILVHRAPGASPLEIEQLLAGLGGSLLTTSASSQLDIFVITDDADLETAITMLTADPRVVFAEPNYIFETTATPNDLQFPQQWSKDNSGINAPNALGHAGADLNMVDAWDRQASAPGIVIAIIDDALETGHADLAANVLNSGRCFASPNSARPCNNGPNDPNPDNPNEFHGTLVAGAAAARGNNGIGIAGVAWETGLLPLKVDLTVFAIADAVDEAVAQAADIINMSFGGPVRSQAVTEAIGRAEAAGILVIASAGNADASNDIASHYPSDTESANVLSVAATNSQDRISRFSQWGATTVHLAAPGESILTTANGDAYASVSGTSFSAPHTAGVAALIKASSGATDYRQIKAHLLHGTVNGRDALGPVIAGQDNEAVPGRVAAGRLDADKAIVGPAGGVLLLSNVAVNDSATGNGNGVLDSGETAQLELTLANVWTTEIGVTGALSSGDSSKLSVNDPTPKLFGTIAEGGQSTVEFSVTLSNSVTDNAQIFMRLDVESTGSGALPSRYFYIEAGTLLNGVAVNQAIQRYNWDEFQAFRINVPAGASDLSVTITGPGDLDLLLRHGQSPEYLITLNATSGQGFYYVDSQSTVSASAGGDESIAIANPAPGTYHAVVVNYDQQFKNYEITAGYTIPTAGSIAYEQASYTVDETGGSATIGVTRTGGIGGASVNFTTVAASAAAGEDYATTSGTLSWGIAENGTKTFVVPILDDSQTESAETLELLLTNVSGATLGAPSTATLEIVDDESQRGTLAFAQAQYTTAESAAELVVSVQRTGGSLGAASVEFATQAGTADAGADFASQNGTLSWPDGDSTSRTITVTIIDDTGKESPEAFTLVLSNPQGAQAGAPATTTVTINDNDGSSQGNGGGGGSLSWLELLAFSLLFARAMNATLQNRQREIPPNSF